MRRLGPTLVAIALTVGLAAFAAPAFAQEVGAAQTGSSDGNKRVKDTTTYDFEGDSVTGNLVKPSNENIQGTTHGKTSSLIDIRSDFVPEMLKSVEDL